MLKNYIKGAEMTLAPNPNYYEGAPKLQTLNFNFITDDATAFANYQSDEIDIDIQKNTPDMFRTGWNADYPDPYDWDRLVLAADSDQNYGHWKNDQFMQLIDQADKAQDPNARIEAYKQAEKIAAADVGNVFVYWYGNFFLVKPWVKGLTYTAQDPTLGAYHYKDAQILNH